MGPKADLDSVARVSHFTDGTVPAHQILNSDVNIMENKQKDPFFAWDKAAFSISITVYALPTTKWPDRRNIFL
jgi:hypothetical protein